ncbi:MAG: prolipoprotein diacylglyceryl transferase [Nitriliruptorales bacterium]
MAAGLAPDSLHSLVGVLQWPILERIPLFGDLAISPHGIGAAVGFLVGAKLMLRRAELRGLGHTYVANVREAVQDLLVRAAIGALVGSRLFYVLTHLDFYVREPLRILFIWEGGLTFLGGVAGAILAALPEARRRDYRLWQLLDSAAPGLAVGIAIGRIGDLAIGDHIGDVAPDFPLAWRCRANFWHEATNSLSFTNPVPAQPYPFGAAEVPTQGCFAVALHQTALYDFLQAALLVVLLLALERRPRWDGFFAAAYVYWYGAFRLGIDFLRQDRRLFGLTGSQYAALTAIVALTLYLWWSKPWQRRPWTWAPPDFDLPWLRATQETATAPGNGGQHETSLAPRDE